jgi:hypothetical protein
VKTRTRHLRHHHWGSQPGVRTLVTRGLFSLSVPVLSKQTVSARTEASIARGARARNHA